MGSKAYQPIHPFFGQILNPPWIRYGDYSYETSLDKVKDYSRQHGPDIRAGLLSQQTQVELECTQPQIGGPVS